MTTTMTIPSKEVCGTRKRPSKRFLPDGSPAIQVILKRRQTETPINADTRISSGIKIRLNNRDPSNPTPARGAAVGREEIDPSACPESAAAYGTDVSSAMPSATRQRARHAVAPNNTTPEPRAPAPHPRPRPLSAAGEGKEERRAKWQGLGFASRRHVRARGRDTHTHTH